MPRELLILITADPRCSTAPAETVRMAAGLGAWKHVIPSLYLHGPAVLCLDEFAEDYPEGIAFTEFLPSINQHGGKIYTQNPSPHLAAINPSTEFQPLDSQALAEVIRQSPALFRV